MTKRILIIPIIIIAIIGVIVGIKSLHRDSTTASIDINLYFLNDTASSLAAEKQTINYDEDEDVTEKVIESLIKGTSNSKNVSIVDKNTKLNSLTKQNKDLIVDFSEEFLSGDQTQNTLAAYAVVKTLCQLPGISSVKITVNSQELLGPDGSRLGFLSGDDINLEKDTDNGDTTYITLYFSDSESNKLIREMRAIKITDTQPLEQYVINELIKGPADTNLQPVLSADTSVISVETSDGTCFVNFSSNFVSRNSGSPEKENAAIYAIVNSLTELDTVDNVQFLVDGKKISSFGTNSISGTFYKNNDMIKE